MEIIIKKNSVIPKDIEEYTKKKLEKLTKLQPRLLSTRVNFVQNASKKRNKSCRVEMVLKGPGATMRAEEDESTFYIAVDSAVDKLRRQLKKLKTKRVDKKREQVLKPIQILSALPPVIADDIEDTAAPTIHMKKYSTKPMSTADAIMQLEVSGGEMMLFVSASNTVQCIRKRPQGGYTLLVPESSED